VTRVRALTIAGLATAGTVTGDTGTDGDDVMVVGPGQKSIQTGAGNDLVCIRLGADVRRYLFLDTGAGDDEVHNETTASDRDLTVYLGTGSDTFVGSDATADFVAAGISDFADRTSDTEKDVIDTRGGNDAVTSGTAVPGTPNPDVITTGAGDDGVRWAGEQTGDPVDLGAGDNRLTLNTGWTGDVDVDAPGGVVTAASRPVLRWTGGVTDWGLEYANSRTTFTGSDLDEYLTYFPSQAAGSDPDVPDPKRRLEADMGAGDDRLELLDAAAGSWTGGPGDDRLGGPRCGGLDVRLGTRFECRDGDFGGTSFSAAIDAWERVSASGDRVRVVGTNGAERIEINADRGRVEARGGRDVVTTGSDRDRRPDRRPIVLLGGRGADHLTGSYGNERLVGGSGNDVLRGRQGRDLAEGGPGRDRCVAEIRRSCERR